MKASAQSILKDDHGNTFMEILYRCHFGCDCRAGSGRGGAIATACRILCRCRETGRSTAAAAGSRHFGLAPARTRWI